MLHELPLWIDEKVARIEDIATDQHGIKKRPSIGEIESSLELLPAQADVEDHNRTARI